MQMIKPLFFFFFQWNRKDKRKPKSILNYFKFILIWFWLAVWAALCLTDIKLFCLA